MIKRHEIDSINSCLNKAEEKEPIFVLRATDRSAPILIRMWADLAWEHGCDKRKILEARELANQMELWHNRKWPD